MKIIIRRMRIGTSGDSDIRALLLDSGNVDVYDITWQHGPAIQVGDFTSVFMRDTEMHSRSYLEVASIQYRRPPANHCYATMFGDQP
jgi:hypothetical protein